MPSSPLQRLFKRMERRLGPLVWHNHDNGYANCEACVIGHAYAPHFATCKCGHCPDPASARERVITDLKSRDAAQREIAVYLTELARA